MKGRYLKLSLLIIGLTGFVNCKDENHDSPTPVTPRDMSGFYFGADLSYVNQILDHGGVYKVEGTTKNPYTIFHDKGTNVVRLRLWHNPNWTKTVYGTDGTQLYNDIDDVEKAIGLAKDNGMKVLLDFHYSDTWADPGKQYIPAAWTDIRDITVLKDSVYHYTKKVLTRLNSQNLMPELVQIGNEINCGMFFTEAPDGFPTCNICNGSWTNMGTVVNAGIDAVREVSDASSIKSKIILHVADPKNVEWWFDNMTTKGSVTDFDMIGFSYYPVWHTTVSPDQLSNQIATFKSKYNKPVLVMEIAYPWTTAGNDSYNNQFGGSGALSGYPFTKKGQSDLMKKIVQEVVDGGGQGVIYWEPAWISSQMKDLWGTGSSWENCAFFEFNGNANEGFDYMTADYR